MQKKYYDGFAVQRIIFDNTDGELMLKLLQAFADEPSAKVIEPKRGEWKEDIGGFSCTVCGYHTDDDGIGNWDITFGRWKYCPSCGAKMERSEE